MVLYQVTIKLTKVQCKSESDDIKVIFFLQAMKLVELDQMSIKTVL